MTERRFLIWGHWAIFGQLMGKRDPQEHENSGYKNRDGPLSVPGMVYCATY